MQKRAFSFLFIAASVFLITSNHAKAATSSNLSLAWVKAPGVPTRHEVKGSDGTWGNIGPIIDAVNTAGYSASGASGAKTYEFKGKYELDISDVVPRPANIPKTPAKVALDVVTDIPRPSVVKAIARALPIIGTTIAVVDFANDLAKAWDEADPLGRDRDGSASFDPSTNSIKRKKGVVWWGPSQDTALSTSPEGACSILVSWANERPYTNLVHAGATKINETTYSCLQGESSSPWTTVVRLPISMAETPITDSAIDSSIPFLNQQKLDDAFEAVKDNPNFSPDLTESEASQNTRVLPSASATSSTTTSTSGNTKTTTTTTPTQSTTTITTTNADNSTSTTTHTTNITYNNNTINTTTTTTTINKDKDGNPLPDTPPYPDTPPTDPDTPPEDPREEVTPPNDPDMPKVPDFYKQKYPDGFKGVWNARIASIKATPLFSLVDALTPSSLGTGGGCPSFSLPVSIGQWNWGTHNISPPCIVWDFGKLFLMLGALLLARALIFGG